ncbi:MAG: SAM-dependent methyltransferase [Bdellovibrionota bacterium]
MSVAKNPLADLWPTQSVELLKSLHILTRDGQLNQDSRRKLKQVQHLVQLITPQLEGLKSIADMGAGKSYLGFMLYDLWMQKHPETHLWAVEQRPELVETCKKLALQSGFERISFVSASINDASSSTEMPAEIDAVTALHACDTATDEAITFAIRKNAKFIALVPCCQAEVARLLAKVPATEAEDLQILWRHGIHKREFGSHLTNVIRCLYLESKGYKVRVTELIGWEHSMKNEIIMAEKTAVPNERSRAQLEALLKKLPLPMKLFELV